MWRLSCKLASARVSAPDIVADRCVWLRRHFCKPNVNRREPLCALRCAHDVRKQVDGNCDVVDEPRGRGLLRVAADRADRVVDAPHAEARGVEVVQSITHQRCVGHYFPITRGTKHLNTCTTTLMKSWGGYVQADIWARPTILMWHRKHSELKCIKNIINIIT